MDCCNYVYAGHFYQQQQHQFCYDNTAPYMPSSSIEANARYNFLPPTYPDYVYNPKEARIRKALREQSRELSRQTLLRNSANVTPTGAGAGAGAGGGLRSSMTGSSSGSNFLDPVSLASSLSSIPDNDPCRGNDSWFSNNGSHHPADIAGVHSRGIDRSKAMMKSFPMGFGYSEFQECTGGVNSDYRVPEFPEGQKWHPYQSNPYHMRPPGPSGNVIHGSTACRSLQEHTWGQFCGVPLPATTNIHNTPRRSRQMVFLQDRQNLPYLDRENLDNQMKMCYRRQVVQETQRDRVPLASAYEESASQQQQQQQPQPPPPPQQQQQQHSQNTRFVTQRCAAEKRESLTEEMSASTGSKDSSRKVPAEDRPEHEEDPNQTSSDTDELPTSSSSTTRTSGCRLQPLPGFHQAFGSTEIGRFSRSEIFASMLGESTSVSSTATKSHEPTVSSSPAVSSSPEEKMPSSSSSSSSSSMMSSSSSTTSSSSSSASSSNSSYQQATGNLAIAVGVAASYRTGGEFNLQQQRWHNPYFPNAIRGEI